MKKILSIIVLIAITILSNAQNVGIGNTSPLMKLHVSSLADTALLLIDNNTALAVNTSAGMYFKNGTYYTGSIRTIGRGTNVARMGFFTFAVNAPTSLRERMSITDDGNVGIGNVNPINAGLIVDTKIGATHVILGSNTTGVAIESAYPGIAFNTYYNGSRKFIAAGYGALLGLDPTNGNFVMYNTAVSGAAETTATISERLRINNAGDVLIATATPFGKLTVSGDNSPNGIHVSRLNDGNCIKAENFGGGSNSAGVYSYSQAGPAIYATTNTGLAIKAFGNSEFDGEIKGETMRLAATGPTQTLRVENFTSGGTNYAILAYNQNGTAIAASSLGNASTVSITGGNGLALQVGGITALNGDVFVGGTLSKFAGTFKIDHPLDPANKYLIHSFVESPDMLNVYNGIIVTNEKGMATAELPSYFEAENIDFKYQLTVMGKSFAQAIVYQEVSANQFLIKTNEPNTKVSWQVTGVRNDAYAKKYRIKAEEEKTGASKGKYLSPELFK